jgi:hypothetical protein
MTHKKVAPALFFQVPALSAEKIEALMERIRDGKYGEKELANLYDNAVERDLPQVMEAVEAKMRADFPRAATRKFGAKKSKADEKAQA